MQSVIPRLILAHLGLAPPQSQQVSFPAIFKICSHTLQNKENYIFFLNILFLIFLYYFFILKKH